MILHQGGQPAKDGGLRFAPTGRRLLANLLREGLAAWDVEQRQPVPLPAGLVRQVSEVGNRRWFGPDGDSVVVASDAGLTLWDLPTSRASLVSPLDSAGVSQTHRSPRVQPGWHPGCPQLQHG
jgi:hypothetical protein